MKNFKVTDKDTGKEYWISRSLAVAGFIVAVYENELYVLLERRGPGCPDNIGKLCGICGYLDFDETLVEAMIRETYEETGLDLNKLQCNFRDIGLEDNNFEGKQNITQRYLIKTDLKELVKQVENGTINTRTKERGGEENEVSEFLIISYSKIKDMNSDEFAFGHKEIIERIYEDYI